MPVTGDTRQYIPCPVCGCARMERFTESFGWEIVFPTHNDSLADCVQFQKTLISKLNERVLALEAKR